MKITHEIDSKCHGTEQSLVSVCVYAKFVQHFVDKVEAHSIIRTRSLTQHTGVAARHYCHLPSHSFFQPFVLSSYSRSCSRDTQKNIHKSHKEKEKKKREKLSIFQKIFDTTDYTECPRSRCKVG